MTEVGHIETFQSAYDGTWTVDVDSDQYRNISWSILASGAAHPGLRFPAAALADTGPLLPQEMRDTHKALRSVLDGSGIDFANHSQANWDHNISFSAPGQTVWSTGSFAGERSDSFTSCRTCGMRAERCPVARSPCRSWALRIRPN